ncbi:glycosyltransferase [Aliiglaciecola sp. CAU 1673]|uniref:glycosyltransferase family 2 protein n=1 Tax=Aliiglaciecola sp. CAU 1673 TaxID=3032595 RepID=UPI0023DB42DF|nr:glycosyltransferase family 2 protein [Aliiglaciecola sp. CAU 1673]MDF2177881.1 glycosyltransferase [Aliiglaciecola sp. CAU 1673]
MSLPESSSITQKKRVISQSADKLYAPLLIALAFVVAVILYRQLSGHSAYQGGSVIGQWLWNDGFSLSLLGFGMLLLLWQVSFALRYKSFVLPAGAELPTLTVVIPAYNEGAQILDTVRSVMKSDYPKEKLQVICIDDGSKDDTWHWIQAAHQEFSDAVSIIKQPTNMGKRCALMAGFAKATGETIVTLDSDSEVLPNTLSEIVYPFMADKRIGSVAGHVRVLNLNEGMIPKMLEVSFTSAFDFIRAGQSVYGGVFCTPGALSAYRTTALMPVLEEWSEQQFLGKPATIGEDRALTNLMLASGHRVVYQRNAVVLTKTPTTYHALRRMLTRWARSNVRESLVMFNFVFKPFRTPGEGANWIRLFSVTQMLRMTLFEALKIALVMAVILHTHSALLGIALACVSAAVIPAVVYYLRHRKAFGFTWALPYTFFWMFTLAWIPLWGMLSAGKSGWLTRVLPTENSAKEPSLAETAESLPVTLGLNQFQIEGARES